MRLTRIAGIVALFTLAASLVAAGSGVAQSEAPAGADAPDAGPAAAGPAAAAAPEADGSPTAVAASEAGTTSAKPALTDLLSLDRLRQRLTVIRGKAEQTRAKVTLLKNAALRGGPSSTATIVHRSKMGEQFRLTRISVVLDGTRVFDQLDDSGALAEQTTFQILAGPVEPGQHNITVELEYRGHGYGPFKYLNKQSFTARNTQSFEAPLGKTVRVESLGYERPDVALERKPAVAFKIIASR